MSDLRAPLSASFAPVDRSHWERLASSDLRGRSLASLRSVTADGVDIEPLYTATDDAVDPGLPGQPPLRRGSSALGAALDGPDLRVEILEPDPARAHALVLEAVQRGATSLLIAIATPTTPGWTLGVHVDDERGLGLLLDGVDLDRVGVHLAPGPGFVGIADDFVELLRSRRVDPARVRGGLGADPIGSLFRDGESPTTVEAALQAASTLALRTAETFLQVRALRVDTDFVHHAGATSAQQIGAALALGVQLLRACETAGLAPARAFAQIEFSLRLDCRFFEQIAMLRAFRVAWSRVGELCGVDDVALRLHAMTSERVLTRRDPWVNLLRGTATTFAALVGGADAVTCASFDQALGAPGDLGRRLSRNTGIVLAGESHLGRVVDPAGGSWFLESLTDGVLERGWEFFREIERQGGALAALRSRWLRERVDEAWRAREQRLRTRREALTGVSEFPDLDERPIEVEARSLDREVPTVHPVEHAEPWPVRRLADPFEQLRDVSDAHLAHTGQRPRVFLATLGPVAAHTSRATWTTNLLEAGGIGTVAPGALDGATAAADAFTASGARVAVICSSDEVYREHAAESAAALKRAGAQRVLLAGKPGEQENAWREAGVDRFVFLGQDVVDVLLDLLREEGAVS